MDPDETWAEFQLAHAEGRRGSMSEYAGYLADWIDSGGYIPLGLQELNPDYSRAQIVQTLRGYQR